ncbi:uncharacterized protein Fot_34275 [Forsythia ovata]|uniref:Uncharacterized protein n=1 Tax=Forsythia ovata TaxID=205694 RepID=A0ABD1SI73_9LAMI
MVNCDLRDSNAMVEDEKGESLGALKSGLKDQKQLDMYAEGFEIGRLSKLVGSEATHLTAELEELYHKMLAKIDGLSKLVEQSSAEVLEQYMQVVHELAHNSNTNRTTTGHHISIPESTPHSMIAILAAPSPGLVASGLVQKLVETRE